MNCRTTRRGLLKAAALGATGWWILKHSGSARGYQANEKLNIALVGVGNRGRGFINTVSRTGQNLVALCDASQQRMASPAGNLPDVRKYQDFRKMLDEMDRQIDAVIVATPDHNHAAISAAAMRRGKHVYCEKPLTHDVGEARTIRQIVNRQKVATQMGNQGVATDAFRRILEQVQQGVVGEIREVHVWYSGLTGSGPRPRPTGTPPVPEGFNWDVFLGPAPWRAYHPRYVSGWGGWREFGTGMLGGGGSHSIHMAFNALNLRALWDAKGEAKGRIRVEIEVAEPCPHNFPRTEILRFDIPPRRPLPAARIHWYCASDSELKRRGIWQRLEKIAGRSLDWKEGWAPTSGSLLVGSKGVVHTNPHNSLCTLLPEGNFPQQGGPPRTLPRAGSHDREWIEGCKGGRVPFSNFDYAGPVIELLLLGNVATLVGKPIEFDPVACKIVNNEEADRALRPERREGWPI